MNPTRPGLLKARDAARVLGISKRTLERYAVAGCPHLADPLRLNVEAVRRWMTDHARTGSPGRPFALDGEAGALAGGASVEELFDAEQADLDAGLRGAIAPADGAEPSEPGEALDLGALREALQGRALTAAEHVRVRQAYALAKAQRERLAEERAALDLARQRGELVALAEVQREWAGLVIAARDRVMSVPGRVADELVGLRVGDIEARLEDELRRALSAIAAGDKA